MGMATGRNPYFSSRKALTSSHPSSGDRSFDGFDVASIVGVVAVWAETPEVHTSRASTTERARPRTLAMGQRDHRTLRPEGSSAATRLRPR
jgi:hypothetical protein